MSSERKTGHFSLEIFTTYQLITCEIQTRTCYFSFQEMIPKKLDFYNRLSFLFIGNLFSFWFFSNGRRVTLSNVICCKNHRFFLFCHNFFLFGTQHTSFVTQKHKKKIVFNFKTGKVMSNSPGQQQKSLNICFSIRNGTNVQQAIANASPAVWSIVKAYYILWETSVSAKK